VPVAAAALPALALLSAGADSLAKGTGDESPACCAELIAAAPTNRVTTAQYRTQPANDGLMLAASRSMHRDLNTALPLAVGSERGLQVKTILVARAVSAIFPEVQSIGGVRPDYLRWHPDGLAIDAMISHYDTPEGIALGDAIVAFVLRNADRLGLAHVIWRQTIYPAHGTPHKMADLGSDNANHYNHVHIATVGGGYPSGPDVYVS
jgi:hypothetical protein